MRKRWMEIFMVLGLTVLLVACGGGGGGGGSSKTLYQYVADNGHFRFSYDADWTFDAYDEDLLMTSFVSDNLLSNDCKCFGSAAIFELFTRSDDLQKYAQNQLQTFTRFYNAETLQGISSFGNQKGMEAYQFTINITITQDDKTYEMPSRFILLKDQYDYVYMINLSFASVLGQGLADVRMDVIPQTFESLIPEAGFPASPLNTSSTSSSPGVMPLKVGNRWEYQTWIGSENFGNAERIVAGTMTTNSAGELFVIREEYAGSYSYSFYRNDTDGLYSYGNEYTGVMSDPAMTVKYPVEVGDNWKESDVQTWVEAVNETITVTAGTFSCIRYGTSYPDSSDSTKSVTATIWYNPGVGEVKMITRRSDDMIITTELDNYSLAP